MKTIATPAHIGFATDAVRGTRSPQLDLVPTDPVEQQAQFQRGVDALAAAKVEAQDPRTAPEEAPAEAAYDTAKLRAFLLDMDD